MMRTMGDEMLFWEEIIFGSLFENEKNVVPKEIVEFFIEQIKSVKIIFLRREREELRAIRGVIFRKI